MGRTAQPLLEDARSKFTAAIKTMSTPHRLAKVARAWKESVGAATQAAGQVGQQRPTVAAT